MNGGMTIKQLSYVKNVMQIMCSLSAAEATSNEDANVKFKLRATPRVDRRLSTKTKYKKAIFTSDGSPPILTKAVCPRVDCKRLIALAYLEGNACCGSCREPLKTLSGSPIERQSRIPAENWIRLFMQSQVFKEAVDHPELYRQTNSDTIRCSILFTSNCCY